jgi:hypothetical protein
VRKLSLVKHQAEPVATTSPSEDEMQKEHLNPFGGSPQPCPSYGLGYTSGRLIEATIGIIQMPVPMSVSHDIKHMAEIGKGCSFAK